MIELATVGGAIYDRTSDTTEPRGIKTGWVRCRPMSLDESAHIVDTSGGRVAVRVVDGVMPPTALWPGQWEFVLPDSMTWPAATPTSLSGPRPNSTPPSDSHQPPRG